ncbi:MAG: indolepyruvate ferredoxin oxidoreductase subunit alpha [Actinobacteria bacterium]|nr:indolepyruvate ferredoxin oxidoreductase subunit alpha [Actinomycetota bacterium]
MENNKNLRLLTGNEAIARAAYESGVTVATAYPGTPSTEILENVSRYSQIYCQWSVNEKVSLEVASGASIAGARALVAMKHVGLNVAADPFMTLSYTGVTGGLVIISADDPGMHSSQNEQDNRFYARFAKVPMLEPSDSQEALDMVKDAFEISEKFDTPVLVRTTTRISHSRSMVMTGSRQDKKPKDYVKNSCKYVMIPAYGRERHLAVLDRWEKLKELCEQGYYHLLHTPQSSKAVKDIGIITSGVSYQYAREVFDNVPVLKLNMTNPVCSNIISEFSRDKRLVIVIEELEPFLEEHIRLLNLKVELAGKQFFPAYGELGISALEKVYCQLFGTASGKAADNNKVSGEKIIEDTQRIESFKGYTAKKLRQDEILAGLPPRPPVLCAGCPHRSVFHVLKKLKTAVMGDIGCYTLSVLPPLNSLDSCLCMGAGVGQALGMEKANKDFKGRVVAVIGDSTFFHSGITATIDNAYNNGTNVIIVLDNGTTAMTGQQDHPGTGRTLMSNTSVQLKPEDFAKAAGIKNIRVVDPSDMKTLKKVFEEELNRDELSFVVCRRPCVLIEKPKIISKVYIDQNICKECGLCLKFGCPAIEFKDSRYSINSVLCTGCNVCADICKFKAIIKKK